ncbi:hypothetical protein [Fulvivirga ligni]|uniref:hypothetical protein n=1 Tax=Fulvivirga ligni TaxID=2904246 RepID=UPI001F2DD331|nr:hypothetical protein [Fulvivirga ligni]UII23501.1 hypothetical protein LVD16_09700 [Fulvivirga ligni]
MININFRKVSIFAILILLTISCDTSLDYENPNDPDRYRVLSDASDVEALAGGLYVNVYSGMHEYDGVQMMLATAADNISCSWGNQAMRDMSWEPRNNAWVNTPAYSYKGTTKLLFDRMYSAINTSSNILFVMDGELDLGDNEMKIRAWCKFIQGVAYGNLALVFDRAFLIDEKTSVESNLEAAVGFETIHEAAMTYLDDAIDFASSNDFTISADWLGQSGDMSSTEFVKLINTYAARFMSYTPRNSAQKMAVDWSKVKEYADAGITSDFNILNDNYVNWYDEAGDYLTYNGWGITDMYVVHLMDASQPQHWDDDPDFPHPAKSTDPDDKRLDTDFAYVASNWFQAARGYYHYSNYRHKRYDAFYVNATGLKPEIMLSENDMLRAEALVYSGGSLSAAADIINSGTRKTRGEMEDVEPVQDDLIQAIHHERHVEMYTTGMGLQFFEMRKLDLLQKGTPLHLPLPAQTLQTLEVAEPYYTFGTEAKADGVNTSNGGWR